MQNGALRTRGKNKEANQMDSYEIAILAVFGPVIVGFLSVVGIYALVLYDRIVLAPKRIVDLAKWEARR